jgi:hypothetical protein
MLSMDKLTEIARDVAVSQFGAKRVQKVVVKPMTDWTGADAISVLYVLHPAAARLLGKSFIGGRVLDGFIDRLDEAGEPRYPYIRYATQVELDAVDDT